MIARYHDPAHEEKRNKHINIIKQAVHNLTNILNEFLSLDRMEEGGIVCHPSTFSLVKFVSELVDEKHILYEQEQRIIYTHKGKTDLIRLDKDILRNILINLLSNAMKYSSIDKKIYLTTELKDKILTIVIQDSGIGIPQADQKHLFERFFRAQNALTIQGTGLGLNIIKKYLNLMGGSIHFKSQENIGTTFTVGIPYEKNSTN
ncbi:MAG: PAS/PAC sensor signal transduction histidine kinase [uncultured bacterium]|nr:MAG: PAS/PAC sensor signal transduction histidine kinase [uncultured bacterium]